jgi:hypothetical protein
VKCLLADQGRLKEESSVWEAGKNIRGQGDVWLSGASTFASEMTGWEGNKGQSFKEVMDSSSTKYLW